MKQKLHIFFNNIADIVWVLGKITICFAAIIYSFKLLTMVNTWLNVLGAFMFVSTCIYIVKKITDFIDNLFHPKQKLNDGQN